jgi:molybdopterin/thiamine biosynthesis adenylyltransferase
VSGTGSVPRSAWYEANPARLQWELDEFARHGLEAEIVTRADGRLVVATELTFRGEKVPLRVVYSYEHPDMPPTLYGLRLLLDRHQDPVGLNYCLLEDPERDWNPWDSAARLVGKDLRRLFRDTELGAEAVRAGEADMPEPVSSQFSYDDELTVLVPDPFLAQILPVSTGAMMLVPCAGDRLWILARAEGIGEADLTVVSRFAGDTRADGRAGWVALDRPPVPTKSGGELVTAAAGAGAELFRRFDRRLREKKRLPHVEGWLGLTFLEEGPTRGSTRRTWVFAQVRQPATGSPQVVRLARAQALTKEERDRRIPELIGLANARLLLIGAGSLGAPVALELAKAGAGRLDVVDNDFYDVNNAVRHVLEARVAGARKAVALAVRCQSLNPFVVVEPHVFQVGGGREEAEQLLSLVEQADGVIDTTGSLAVARVLARNCAEARRPLLVAGLTSSSYGAEVLVVGPDGPCLDCFVMAQAEGAIPEPPAGPGSVVTPVGCRHPAFAGAGFEATEVAAVVARTAVRLSVKTVYPELDFNWVVMSFRADLHYRQGTAASHPRCPSPLH